MAKIKSKTGKKPTSAATKKAVTKTPAKKPAAKKSLAGRTASKPASSKTVKKTTRVQTTARAKTKAAGIPEQMRDVALKILDERKAEEIVTIELTGRSSVADYMIIASGKAARQIAAIADYLREAFMKLGCPRVRVEGKGEANWVLIDSGDVIVHLFRPEVRTYYDLDAIWNGKSGQK